MLPDCVCNRQSGTLPIMKPHSLLAFLIAVVIGLGGASITPQASTQPGAMNIGVVAVAAMSDAPMQMDGCPDCNVAQQMANGCEFVCPPVLFTTDLNSGSRIDIGPEVLLPLATQDVDGQSPTPAQPPPIVTTRV